MRALAEIGVEGVLAGQKGTAIAPAASPAVVVVVVVVVVAAAAAAESADAGATVIVGAVRFQLLINLPDRRIIPSFRRPDRWACFYPYVFGKKEFNFQVCPIGVVLQKVSTKLQERRIDKMSYFFE